MVDHGVDGWLTLGGVVLCVTGAEALYADRGHFGAGPIRATWFSIVLPAVMLYYLGQSALILHDHAARRIRSICWRRPGDAYPLVFLATAATIIASQAALTGSFSVAKQAVQLGFLPRLRIVHTSELEGQIYVPLINWALCAGVVTLVLVFRSSSHLADIYGVAVTGTFILDTTLFLAVARSLWGTAKWKLAILGAVFYTSRSRSSRSNLSKVGHGAWLPLVRRPGRRDDHGHLAQGPRHRHPQPRPCTRARWRSSWTACATPSRRSCACPAPPSSSTPARRPARWRSAPRSSTTTPSTRRW